MIHCIRFLKKKVFSSFCGDPDLVFCGVLINSSRPRPERMWTFNIYLLSWLAYVLTHSKEEKKHFVHLIATEIQNSDLYTQKLSCPAAFKKLKGKKEKLKTCCS